MEEKILSIRRAAREAISVDATNLKELDAIRVKFLGKKGELSQLMRGMGQLDEDARRNIGKLFHAARTEIEALIADKTAELKSKELAEKLATEKIDITLPGRRVHSGRLHPLTLTLNRVKEIFLQMGYTVEDGPEVETDYYNFEALNLPKDHPARDMQDSFYITDEILMRTQTSPVQARTMERHSNNEPIRMIAPGRVYRRDDYDASHSPMFTQVEGLVIDERITFGDLKGTLEYFLKQMFGEKARMRLRPSFFPFTEPSAEVDVSCVMCGGHGTDCKVCHGSGWLEILGAGMVHPDVLSMSGYDPKVVSGFAFGLGIERIAMLKYGVDDMRLFYDNDVRFLNQF